MKTNHYIVTVHDRLNEEDIIRTYVDETTDNKAVRSAKKHISVKQYVGNDRYSIKIRQNPIFIQ